MTSLQTTLDSVLVQLGESGRYQKYVLGLFCVAVIMHSAAHIAFVFTAKDLSYRCNIPGCDSETDPAFKPPWIRNAIPFDGNTPRKCEKFRYVNFSSPDVCSSEHFDRSVVESCNSYVYDTPEVTIVNDFDLHCEENLWKLTLIGTINNVGQFVGLPLAGLVSDKYGRRTSLILGMVFCAIAGIARAFSTSYIWFVIFEFLDAAFGSGTYACGFILGVELVVPKKRVLSGTIVSSCYAIGEVYVALVAWLLQSWKPIILAVYIPPLFLLSYFWIAPESIRWLLTQGRKEEAVATIQKAAKINKKEITEESLKQLTSCGDESTPHKYPMTDVFKSSILVLRFINSCLCWITCTFLFYGLTLHSVSLAGNPYLDFILTSLVEIPAYFATYFVVDRLGRRWSQCGSFLLTSVACVAIIFVHEDYEVLQLCIYLFGKFGATMAFTVCYIISTEIFPTSLRQSMMGICSMFGRIGSMVSPQTPLLAQIWAPLPLVLFSIMGTIAGLLSLLFPETLNMKLPDTVEEAILIGKSTDSLPCKS